MRHPLRIEPIAALLAGLIVASALPAAAAEPKGQIYQQRAADGRIVLTDRPSATAVTERTWEVEREDKVAAQQRAQEVRREADAVSERVQRRIEAQERTIAAERERAWQSQQSDRQMARYDDGPYYPGYVDGGGYSNGRFWYEKPVPFFEVGSHRNALGTPTRKPSHHHSRSSGRSKHK
jgi:hypothetical protein